MATAPLLLSREEFHTRYDGLKPAYEYWYGEAVQKAVGTVKHGALQILIAELLRQAGYNTFSELELRISPDWEPVPDVVGVVGAWKGGPYPTEPVEWVVEILSPEDRMSLLLRKCRDYARLGINCIFVLDPDDKVAWRWDAQNRRLEIVERLALPNGNFIEMADVWNILAERVS